MGSRLAGGTSLHQGKKSATVEIEKLHVQESVYEADPWQQCILKQSNSRPDGELWPSQAPGRVCSRIRRLDTPTDFIGVTELPILQASDLHRLDWERIRNATAC